MELADVQAGNRLLPWGRRYRRIGRERTLGSRRVAECCAGRRRI